MPSNTPTYAHEYYMKNRESILKSLLEVIECECKARSTRTNIARHRKSKKHLRRMEQISKVLS